MTDRYEALRVARSASRERELFIRRGMVAWIDAWSGCSPGCGVEVDCGGREDAPCRGVAAHWGTAPEGVQAQVAELLVGIAWAVTRS